MNWSSSKKWAARVGAAALALGIGASAAAGPLYSWKTEDGTFAYTNERKQIPARYKYSSKTSKLESMESYDRFTPGPQIADKAYADRIVERLEVLRASSDRTQSTDGAARVGQSYSVRLGLGGRGSGSNVSIEIPVGALMDDAEPVVVETVRVRPGKGHSTTRHFQVVKQGDRVLAVIKGEHNDNPLTPKWDEEDFE